MNDSQNNTQAALRPSVLQFGKSGASELNVCIEGLGCFQVESCWCHSFRKQSASSLTPTRAFLWSWGQVKEWTKGSDSQGEQLQ